MKKIYPRAGDTQTVYLNAVVKDPLLSVHCHHPFFFTNFQHNHKL